MSSPLSSSDWLLLSRGACLSAVQSEDYSIRSLKSLSGVKISAMFYTAGGRLGHLKDATEATTDTAAADRGMPC